MTLEYEEAAREWRGLLAARGSASAHFMDEHFGTAMRIAVALFSRAESLSEADSAAIRAACASDTDEQMLLEAAAALRRLLDVVVRDRMTFLLPGQPESAAGSSASHRESLARQQALRGLLPPSFQQRFRQQLLDHWEELSAAAGAAKLSLPRVQQLDWAVARESPAPAPPVVLLRIQTSDGGSRRVEVPLREFHRLRYSAAKVLQEMRQVEAHPIMRLAHMELQTDTAGQARAP